MLGGTLNPFHIFQSKRTGASQFGLIFGGKCGQNYSDRLNLVWDDIVGAEFGSEPTGYLGQYWEDHSTVLGAWLLSKQCFMINTWLGKEYHDHHMVMIIMIVHHRNHHHHHHHQNQLLLIAALLATKYKISSSSCWSKSSSHAWQRG